MFSSRSSISPPTPQLVEEYGGEKEGLPGVFNILYSGEYTSKKCFSLDIILSLSQISKIVKLKLV
jgi:hypothetical protein